MPRIKRGITKLGEKFLEFFISVFFPKVFDVDIGELHGFGPKLTLPFFAGLKVTNKSTNTMNDKVRGNKLDRKTVDVKTDVENQLDVIMRTF